MFVNSIATVEPVNYEFVDIDPSAIGLLRELAIELHRHESRVQPALDHAPARPDEEYWRLYMSRFGAWFADGEGICIAARAIDGGEIVGFVFAVEKEGATAYDAGERIGYVEEIAVLEKARGQGIGRALMDAARERFRRRGLTSFKLSTVPGNEPARAFYESLGLAPAARLLIGRVDD